MRRNWMPLYIPDFLADTMHLSAAETGAYLCLIMDYWLHDGLPDDDAKLAQIARLPTKSWRAMRPTIEAFFHDGWRHKRIDAELTKMIGTSIRRTQAASKAGTISSIKRANGTSTQRTHDVNAAYTPRAPSVHHTTQEYLTTTSRDTARARQNGENPPENEANEAKSQASRSAGLPAGFAEKAREAVQKTSNQMGSDELVASMQARRWVP
jgi:uncharacterized protein YdaU (DUF1376 family)